MSASRWTRAHGPLPRGATFAVSLQPCRMCAAAIVAAASDPLAVAVRYLEPDPGPHAARTWLDEIGTLARGAVEAADEPHGA
ncbi:MAG TPA: Bd3614 family nucleic acid deaminase [Myxococcota bacterium]|nr:Bd3614 family nucleic acid deaminase [Myxococcota bacterium]